MVLNIDVLPKEGVPPETGLKLFEPRLYSGQALEDRLSIPSKIFSFNMGHGDRELHAFRYNKRLSNELETGTITKEKALEMLEAMMLGRELETMSVKLQYEKKYGDVKNLDITFPTHLAIGTEAMTVGALFAIEPDDYITSTHRGHVDALVKGYRAIKAMTDAKLVELIEENEGIRQRIGLSTRDNSREQLIEQAIDIDIYRTIAELFGKKDGFCSGKGGGMHLAWVGANNLGNNAIVGGLIGIGAGSAFASRYFQDKKVTLAIAGDGAYLNENAYGAFNLATMGQLKNGIQSTKEGVPVVFTCYNNMYAMTCQQIGEVTDVKYLAQKVVGWDRNGMHAEVAFGMDVLAVHDLIKRAAETARSGKGPVFAELIGTRFYGHSLSDDGVDESGKGKATYRTPKEIYTWKSFDPISLFASQVVSAGLITEEQFTSMQGNIQQRIQRLAKLAWESDFPTTDEMFTGLYTSSKSDGKIEAPPHIAKPKEFSHFERKGDGRIGYSQAVTEAIIQEMMRDGTVILIGEDIGEYGGAFGETKGIYNIFGADRVINTSLNEANIAGVPIGMALRGMRPISKASMYIDFLTLALDQIGNHAAKLPYMSGGQLQVPIVFWTDMGGGMGYAGQHSQNLEAMIAMFPGLKVVAPATSYDAKGLMIAAIRDNNPVVYIGHQNLYKDVNKCSSLIDSVDTRGSIPTEPYEVPIGIANVFKKIEEPEDGKAVTLVSYSWMMNNALKAANMFEQDGYQVEVIDLRTLLPIDYETISESLARTHRLVIAHQACRTGGLGLEIAGEIASNKGYFYELSAPIQVVGAPFTVPPCSRNLEQSFGPIANRNVGFIPGDIEIYQSLRRTFEE